MTKFNYSSKCGLATKAELESQEFKELINQVKSLEVAGISNAGWDTHWSRRWEFPTVLNALIKHHQNTPVSQVMESGSGITQVPFWLANFGINVTGVDLQENLKQSWEKITTSAGKAEFIQGDMLNLPFENNSFDASYSISALEHTGNAFQGVSEMIRVTKPKGLIVLTMDIDIKNSNFTSQSDFYKSQDLLNELTTPAAPFRIVPPSAVLSFNSHN
jgi:ubiquinone/menaquinone biosynthesis C-methylase UbiE